MVDLSTARQNIVSEIIDGTPNTITPSKLRQLLTDTIDAIDALLLPFSVFDADATPTANDDGANTSGNGVFAVGSKWYDQNAGEAYECLNNATGAAVWVPTTIDISDLGTAAAYNVGTSPNSIVQLNESGELPVVSGANLTNLPGADASTEFLDNVFRIQDNSDPTKEIDFDASGIATGTKRTITAPDRDVDLGDVKKINDAATAAPTTDDDNGDGYTVGSIWNDISAKAAHILFDSSLGAAVWKSIAFLENLASTAEGQGASLIALRDVANNTDATNAEAAFAELYDLVSNAAVSNILHIQDQKPSGTDGGTFSSGADITRTLNTIVTNEIAGSSLASNQVTLPSGEFLVFGVVPAYDVQGHQAFLYNLTDGVKAIQGQTAHTNTFAMTNSVIIGRITIEDTKVFQIRHRSQSSKSTTGFGNAFSFGTEIYTQVLFIKVGD